MIEIRKPTVKQKAAISGLLTCAGLYAITLYDNTYIKLVLSFCTGYLFSSFCGYLDALRGVK